MAELLARLWSQAVTVTGILDILLVWFVVFQALRLLRGSDAGHLKGLGILLGLLAVAWLMTRPDHGLLPLPSFHWLLTQLAPFALVGLLIVFQPEIRQSFGQLGQVSLFGRPVAASSRSVVVHVVNEIVRAAGELSTRKIGALMALERRDRLAEIIETGKDLDAEISAELLISIFFPNTPLHDGAAVIRRDQVVAAACLLPLSERRDLASSVGTRHRAALGLAERTDAVIVVISEETGAMSLAYGGELFWDLREEDFKGRLIELLQPAGGGLLAAAAETERKVPR